MTFLRLPIAMLLLGAAVSAFARPGQVDPTFHAALLAKPDVALPLPDGKIVVAGGNLFSGASGSDYSVARLNSDGSLDATFTVAVVSGDIRKITQLILQRDGCIVVRGSFTSINNLARPTLARLESAGAVDTSFHPDAALRDSVFSPILLADGSWLTATHAADANDNRTVAIARFRPDGSADPAFAPYLLTATTAAPVKFTDNPNANYLPARVIATVDATGRIYIAAAYNRDVIGHVGLVSGNSLLFRLNPDGTRDRSFSLPAQPDLATLIATTRGIVGVSFRYASGGLNGDKSTRLFRLNFDGTEDASFCPTETRAGTSTPFYYDIIHEGFDRIALLGDGSIVANGTIFSTRSGIVHFRADGAFDPDYWTESGEGEIFPLANGQILNLDPNGLQRITPNTRATATRIVNLSVRGSAGTADDTLIAGFVTTGGDKQLLLRAIGPTLGTLGVTGALADPQLTLIRNSQSLLANDDWENEDATAITAAALRAGAFSLLWGSRDAAMIAPVTPGVYSLLTPVKNSTHGVALVEVYDLDAPPADAASPRLVNLSARARAGSGSETLIAGFVIVGDANRSVLIRALGPSLTPAGVAHPLADPALTLTPADGSTPETNDNWSTYDPSSSGEALRDRHDRHLSQIMKDLGASPPAQKDAVLFLSLPPGIYTAQVSSKDGSAGVALVEIYEAP